MATENIPRIASDFETQLSASIAIGATSFTIQDVVDADGMTLSDGLYCFTIARNTSAEKEYLFGQLTTATKTVSSIYTVSRQGVLTANAARAHRIGSNVIISDHGAIAAISRIFAGLGTINPAAPLEYTTAPTLSSATQIATKGYVDSVVSGGTVNTDRIILGSQTAGETVAAGNIVYFKSSDSRWWKTDADLTATFSNVILGVALGAGTAGNTISGGVQIYGKCDSFTGLTATATYYLSNTAGGVSSSAGTNEVILGQAFSTTGIFFNPIPPAISTSAGVADASKLIKTNASGLVDETFIPFDYVKTVVYASGSDSQSLASNTTKTIAHGLGVIPHKVRLTIWMTSGGDSYAGAGVYDASGQRTLGVFQDEGSSTSQNDVLLSDTTKIIYVTTGGSAWQRGAMSVDATNLTITFTSDNSPSGTYYYIWEAEGYTI